MRMLRLVINTWLVFVLLIPVALAGESKKEEAIRPKIGLVLSGGGARGGAHIGVLKALEELHIPIDYIAGTSMGAIIGAFYAAGYSPQEIEKFVSETQWKDAFSDQPDRAAMNMRKKQLDADFLIPQRVGFNGGELELPLGLIEGQKLDLIFQRAFLRVDKIHNFDRLRVPFRAVATNLATGSEVVLRKGSLAMAVRASMSIPAIFAPVILNDMMLVDGGMANNLPISVVREMGADIVIAVDISSPLLPREKLDSVLTVTEQLTNFLTRRNTERQIATLGPQDILLVPALGDFGSTDFNKVLDIVPAGYAAVMERQAALVALARDEEDTRARLAEFHTAEEANYIVHFVEINNASIINNEIIRSRLDIELDQPLDFVKLENSLSQIYSIDVFQSVNYELVTNKAGESGIAINAEARSWGPNYLQFGIEFSDDFNGNSDYQIGAAYTRNALNSYAGQLRTAVAVGREGLLDFDFYQPIDQQARWFVEPRALWTRQLYNVYDEDQFRAQIEITGPGLTLGIGRNFNNMNLVRLDYELYRGKAGVLIGDSDLLTGDEVKIGEFVLRYQHDSLDDLWFPRKGKLVTFGARFAGDKIGAASDYQQAFLGVAKAWASGKNSVQLNMQAGYSFEDAVPLERWYELGGFGRLSGLAPDQISGRQMGLATFAYYRRLNEADLFPLFAGFTLETGNVWLQQSDVSFSSLRYSGSVFLGADTPIGPVYLAYGHSDDGQAAVYFYLGNPWRAARW
ncbi:MAG: patatin [Xanthomonadales bacterium]|nr:patatin [Xanthomonadales bacterium]